MKEHLEWGAFAVAAAAAAAAGGVRDGDREEAAEAAAKLAAGRGLEIVLLLKKTSVFGTKRWVNFQNNSSLETGAPTFF